MRSGRNITVLLFSLIFSNSSGVKMPSKIGSAGFCLNNRSRSIEASCPSSCAAAALLPIKTYTVF